MPIDMLPATTLPRMPDVSACSATGAAGLFAVGNDPDARQRLHLHPDARVLLIGTEAAGAA